MKGLKFWEMCSAVIFLGGALMFGAGCLLDATLSSPWCAAGGTAVIVSIALGIGKMRCPCCRHFLGVLFFPSDKKRYCPWCGCNMEEETQKSGEKRAINR